MLLLRRVLEAIVNGLLVALLAPPVAALAFLAIHLVTGGASRQQFDSSVSSVLLLLIGMATGSYFLGGIPAFLAGLALPTFRRVLSPVAAAMATGLLGAVTYALTFGAHLMSGPNQVASIRTYALPAFIGVAVAASQALRIEQRYAEAPRSN